MKKLIICIALLCSLTICTACGKSNDSSNDSKSLTTAQDSENIDDSTADFISEVSKENYTEVPDEAMDAFNYVSKNIKKVFTEADGKWMYGYKGCETVCGEECYIFAVYTENEESSLKVGIVAKAKDSDNLYKSDYITEQFSKVTISNDSDNSWAKTPTKFKDK